MRRFLLAATLALCAVLPFSATAQNPAVVQGQVTAGDAGYVAGTIRNAILRPNGRLAVDALLSTSCVTCVTSWNWAQTNGSTVALGTGVASANTPRVAVASDSTIILGAGSATIGALTANQSVNVTQILSSALTTGTGAASANTPRVAVASDSSIIIAAGTADIGNVGVAQASTTSGQKGPLTQGAVTTAAPSYTTAQTSPLSLTTGGGLRTDATTIAGTATAVGSGVVGNGTQRMVLATDVALPAGTNLLGSVGNAQASTTSGQSGPLAQGAVTTGPSTYTTAQTSPLSLTTASGLRVDTEGQRQTYSAAALNASAVATGVTDTCTLTGSGTKTIRVTRVEFSGYTTSATSSALQVHLIKRSSANLTGTSSAVSIVPHDSTNSAATATPLIYTANPGTLGTTVGNVRSTAYLTPSTTSVTPAANVVIWDFTTRNEQAVLLRGTAQVLAINQNAANITGNIVYCGFTWTEE